MYDDDVQPPLLLTSVSKYTKVAKFPTRNIKTPVVLVYGGSDSLVDIDVMRRELPSHTVATEIPHYEHLDFLWAREVDALVFPHVFDALESFCDAEHSKEEYERYRSARHASLGTGMSRPALPLSYMSDENARKATKSYVDGSVLRGGDADMLVTTRQGIGMSLMGSLLESPNGVARNKTTTGNGFYDSSADNSPIVSSHIRTARQESFGSDGAGDERIANGDRVSVVESLRSARRGSIGRSLSFEGSGSRGISLGAGKAVSGVVQGVETLGNLTSK